jgi:hypothetical protein
LDSALQHSVKSSAERLVQSLVGAQHTPRAAKSQARAFRRIRKSQRHRSLRRMPSTMHRARSA